MKEKRKREERDLKEMNLQPKAGFSREKIMANEGS